MVKLLLAYLTVYIVWGSTYYFIKLAVEELPPFWLVGLRFSIGGIILLGAFLVNKAKYQKITIKQFVNASIIGILLLAGGNGFVSMAEKKVDSYLAALIVACTPVVVLFYDSLLFRKKVSLIGWCGAILGVFGVAVLLLRGSGFSINWNIHIVYVLLAVFLWAMGTSLSKVLEIPKDSFVNTTIQLCVVGFGCLIGAAIETNPSQINWFHLSMPTWIALLFLSLIGMVALVAFSYLLYNQTTTRVVTYAFVNPIIAVGIGIILGKEEKVPYLLPGILLILSGLFLTFYGDIVVKMVQRSFQKQPL